MVYKRGNYPKKDIYQDINNQIIAEMEKGELPWQKGWDSKVGNALLCRPQNAVTGEAYHKSNALTLALAVGKIGDGDPRFCSFNQAKEKGWIVKKGSHGFPVLHGFWADKDKFGHPLPEEDQHWERRFTTVFHASQLEMANEQGKRVSIPPYEPGLRSYTHNETLELAESMLKKSGALIYHDQGDKAYYMPLTDDIHLPPKEAFPKLEDYYSTALHELGHWTGHEARLNRDLKNSFGSEEYAKEELRAEMASVYLSMETGLPFNPSNHAAYTQSWLTALKKDKNEFFKAAADAEKIADYIIELAKEKKIEQETEKKSLLGVSKIEFREQNGNSYEMDTILAANNLISNTEEAIDYKITVTLSNKASYSNTYKFRPIDSLKYKPLEMHISKMLADEVGQVENILIDKELYKKFNDRLDAIDDVKDNTKGILNAYKKEFKQALSEIRDTESGDIKAVQALLLKNEYSTIKIKEAVMKCSPKAAVLGKAYADELVKKTLTPEFKNEIKAHQAGKTR